MNDIFISYAREDLEVARRLAAMLEEQGWSVFWDRTIPAGKSWREVIGAALAQARCVVVLWSKHSVDSHWVIEEADSGLRRRVLIPAFIEPVEPPWGFGSIQAADLSGWSGDREDATIKRFFGDVTGILGPAPDAGAEYRPEAKAEIKRKAEEQQRQQAEAEARRKAEEERERAEAETRRQAEEQRRQAEAEARRKAEEERQRAEAEAGRQAEEQRRQAEAEVRRWAEEAIRQVEEQHQAIKLDVKRSTEDKKAKQPIYLKLLAVVSYAMMALLLVAFLNAVGVF